MTIDKTNPITRKDLYRPVSDADMAAEADAEIDPKTVPVMKPSWALDDDGIALYDDKDPGHYLSRKLITINTELKSSRPNNNFDDRLFFRHPLDVQYYWYPTNIVTPTATPAPTAAAGATTAAKFANLQKVTLASDPTST